MGPGIGPSWSVAIPGSRVPVYPRPGHTRDPGTAGYRLRGLIPGSMDIPGFRVDPQSGPRCPSIARYIEVNLSIGEPRKTVQLYRVCAVCSAMGLPVEKVPQPRCTAQVKTEQPDLPDGSRVDFKGPVALGSRYTRDPSPGRPGTRVLSGGAPGARACGTRANE